MDGASARRGPSDNELREQLAHMTRELEAARAEVAHRGELLARMGKAQRTLEDNFQVVWRKYNLA